MNWKLVLTLLAVSIIACSVQTQIPHQVTYQPRHVILRSQVKVDAEVAVWVRDQMMNKLYALQRGETVTVIERQGDWCQIGDGKQVYCACLSGYEGVCK